MILFIETNFSDTLEHIMRETMYVLSRILFSGECSRGIFTLYSLRASLVSRGYLENKLYATHASLYTEPVFRRNKFRILQLQENIRK